MALCALLTLGLDQVAVLPNVVLALTLVCTCVLQHASSSLAGRLWLLLCFLLHDACLPTRSSVVKQCLFTVCTYRCQGMAYALTSVNGWHSWLGLCSFKLLATTSICPSSSRRRRRFTS
jgi:hypothetical protein